jgi:hypothetical protein
MPIMCLWHAWCLCRVPTEEDGDDGGDDDDEELRVWNLRKCSAAALDTLSTNLGDEHILPLLLPIVQERLQDPDWRCDPALLHRVLLLLLLLLKRMMHWAVNICYCFCWELLASLMKLVNV